MVIGTAAIVDTEIDGAVGMNSGIFNNPFIIWGKYRRKWLHYELPSPSSFTTRKWMEPMQVDSLRNYKRKLTNCNIRNKA